MVMTLFLKHIKQIENEETEKDWYYRGAAGLAYRLGQRPTAGREGRIPAVSGSNDMIADREAGGTELGGGRTRAGRQGALADVRAAIGEGHYARRRAWAGDCHCGGEGDVLAPY